VIRNACRRAFEKARALGIKLSACEFGPDHAHIFLSGCKNYSIPELAQHFKGFSSRILRRDHWDRVSRYEWGKSFWSDGYFHESVGRVTSETVRYYIERQKKKHWIGYTTKKLHGQTKLADFAS
jgi:putative transposase